MVAPLPPGSRPFTGTVQTGTPASTGQPASKPSGSGDVPPVKEKSFFGGITSFFKSVGDTIDAWFNPVDDRVKAANFRPNPGSQAGAALAAQNPANTGAVTPSQSLPSTSASYGELANHIRANQNINYFELERGNVNRGLSTYLNQFSQALDANPGLREQLAQTEAGQALLAALDSAAKGQLGTDDIINIQKFIVASGVGIGYEGNTDGIDGQYGPLTHAGLQAAFNKLLQDPTSTVQTLTTGIETANQGVENFRRASDGQIDRYIPGQSQSLPDTDPVNPTGPPPVATDLGQRIWESAKVTAGNMGNSGKCLKGVRLTLDRIGIKLRDKNGNNLPSAYMAADALATRYKDQFTEMKPVSKGDLRSLPPGAVVVWDRNPSQAKRDANPNNGFTHGHIEVIGPGGQAISDGNQRWGVTMNNNGRYGGFRVFLPNS